jgi:hypothetical protein
MDRWKWSSADRHVLGFVFLVFWLLPFESPYLPWWCVKKEELRPVTGEIKTHFTGYRPLVLLSTVGWSWYRFNSRLLPFKAPSFFEF